MNARQNKIDFLCSIKIWWDVPLLIYNLETKFSFLNSSIMSDLQSGIWSHTYTIKIIVVKFNKMILVQLFSARSTKMISPLI